MYDKELMDEAYDGNRGDEQAAIAKEVIRWGAMMLRKNHDYGGSVWERPLLAPDCDPGVAIRVRMSDKLSRLMTLLKQPAQVTGESIDDTLRDLGAYCLLELARPGRASKEKQARKMVEYCINCNCSSDTCDCGDACQLVMTR